MERIRFCENVDISRMVYGMWRLTDDSAHSTEMTIDKVKACLDQGITTIDQANIYGAYTAEAEFGKALKKSAGLRQQIEIISKCDIVWPAGRFSAHRVKHYDSSYAHIAACVEQSLTDLHTDYLDVLLIHRPDPLMDHHQTGAILDQLIDEGKIKSAGVSNFRPWDIELLQSAMKHPLVTNQIELSLQHHQPLVDGDVAFLQRRGLPIMAWSPLAGGELFNHSEIRKVLERVAHSYDTEPDAIAVAWLMVHPATIIPVLGTNNIERIKNIHRAADIQLDRETWFELYTASLGREVA
jgi:predicted oxidoreductase